ncbi:hypothetical protein N836_26780 [Leptolyngbya sp. Heron Island J]|nr:hypothetical protein N836_26780 [Leptolyngbya sp. Heron Island J]
MIIKLFGISLTLTLSALMTEIGEASQTTSEPIILSMDRIEAKKQKQTGYLMSH